MPPSPPTDTHAARASLPSVSVVVPTYNRRDRLERVVIALQAQDYPADKVDIIVVLDGCTDDSRPMLERLARRGGPRLVVIEQPSSGPSVARNRGAAAATGDLLVFIDDDVVAAPRVLLEHALAHGRRSGLVTIGTMMPPPDFDRPVWVRWEEQMLLRQYRAMQEGRYRATFRQFFSGNCAMARRSFTAAGGFDPEFRRAEDIELAFRLARLGLTFAFLPRAEAHHYAHRPFRAWAACHYAYGYNDVVMERQRGLPGHIATIHKEFRARQRPIRWLCRAVLDRRHAQEAADRFFLGMAEATATLRLPRLAAMSLSCISNYRYWQGFNDGLRQVVAAPAEPAVRPGNDVVSGARQRLTSTTAHGSGH